METTSIPTPTMPMAGQVNGRPGPVTMRSAQRTEETPGNTAKSSGRDLIGVAVAQPGGRIQQHRRLLPLLRRAVVEAPVRWALIHRRAARDRRDQPALAGQQALVRTPLVIRALIRIQ